MYFEIFNLCFSEIANFLVVYTFQDFYSNTEKYEDMHTNANFLHSLTFKSYTIQFFPINFYSAI